MRSRISAVALIAFLMAMIGYAAAQCDFSQYKPLRIGAAEGKVIKRSVDPKYPSEARKLGIGGMVNLQVLFDADGIVRKACAISGHPLLRKAAETAALKTVFFPVLLNGKRVLYIEQHIVFNFVAPNNSNPPAAATVPYCELVKDEKYDGKVVRVSGLFITDFEVSTLESSDCPVPKESGPFGKLWVDFDPAFDHATKNEWRQAIENLQWRRPAEVIFVGHYECRRSAPAHPGQGFGHQDMYPRGLVVIQAEFVRPLTRAEK